MLVSVGSSWNERYSCDQFVYGVQPNEFLRIQAFRLSAGARVLCLAEGEGRNSTYLAGLGMQVTGVDSSVVGVQKTQRLARERGVQVTARVGDLADFDLGTELWDAQVSIFAHLPPPIRRSLRPRMKQAMSAGGLLILEHYHPRQLEYGTGGPQDPSMMTTLKELERDFAGWSILHRFEGERDVIEGVLHQGRAYVTQFVAQKPAA
jgi:hypothetical protein